MGQYLLRTSPFLGILPVWNMQDIEAELHSRAVACDRHLQIGNHLTMHKYR